MQSVKTVIHRMWCCLGKSMYVREIRGRNWKEIQWDSGHSACVGYASLELTTADLSLSLYLFYSHRVCFVSFCFVFSIGRLKPGALAYYRNAVPPTEIHSLFKKFFFFFLF